MVGLEPFSKLMVKWIKLSDISETVGAAVIEESFRSAKWENTYPVGKDFECILSVFNFVLSRSKSGQDIKQITNVILYN